MQIWFKSTAGRVETVAIFCEPSPWTGFETNSKIPASCHRKYWPTLMISLVGDFITVGNNSVFIFTNKFHDFQMWALAFFLLRYCCSRFSKSFVTTLYSAIFWPITSILRYGRFLTTLMNLFDFLRPLSCLAMCVCGGGGVVTSFWHYISVSLFGIATVLRYRAFIHDNSLSARKPRTKRECPPVIITHLSGGGEVGRLLTVCKRREWSCYSHLPPCPPSCGSGTNYKYHVTIL